MSGPTMAAWIAGLCLAVGGQAMGGTSSVVVDNVGADLWGTNGSSDEAAIVADAAAPSGKAWVMKPGSHIGEYEVVCSYPAKMTPGRYRLVFHIQLHQAAGTVVSLLCSGAADQPVELQQPIYPTQPNSTNYLALPLDVTVTKPDPKLWLGVKYAVEPEPRRIGVEISKDAHIRFGGVTIQAFTGITGDGPLQISVGEFSPTRFAKCWPMARVFMDGTTLLSASNDPNFGWHASVDRKEWRAIAMPKATLSSFLERPGKGILALSWENKGDDPAAIPGTLYRAESGQAWADGKAAAEPISFCVPLAIGGKGEGAAYKPACVMEKSLLELRDGSLLASVYGWLKGQADLTNPNNPQGDTRYSTWFVRSTDGGKKWVFQGQVPYHKTMGGPEGFCEPSTVRFPDNGELLCMMRTGSGFPLYQSRSTDDGRTWAVPQPAVGAMYGDFTDPGTMRGVWPSLVLMQNGIMVCSWGRTPPGVHLAFSLDRGHTWAQLITLSEKSMSSYICIQEIRPGVLLTLYDNGEVLGFQEVTVKGKPN